MLGSIDTSFTVPYLCHICVIPVLYWLFYVIILSVSVLPRAYVVLSCFYLINDKFPCYCPDMRL